MKTTETRKRDDATRMPQLAWAAMEAWGRQRQRLALRAPMRTFRWAGKCHPKGLAAFCDGGG